MSRIVKIGETEAVVRSLTYREFKEMKKRVKAENDFDEVEYIFEKIFTREQRDALEELPSCEVLEIYREAIAESTGKKEEEKN